MKIQRQGPAAFLLKNQGSNYIRGSMGPRAVLDVVTKRKIIFCWESNPGLPACSLATVIIEIYWLLDCWLSLNIEEVNFLDISMERIGFFRVELTQKWCWSICTACSRLINYSCHIMSVGLGTWRLLQLLLMTHDFYTTLYKNFRILSC